LTDLRLTGSVARLHRAEASMARRGESTRPGSTGGITRRDLLKTAGVAAASGSVLATVREALAAEGDVLVQGPGAVEASLTVNGETKKVSVEPRETLLDVLRLPLDLTGAKRVCDRGSCGACTVLLDGRPVNSCMVLALDAVGKPVTTVEGLARSDGGPLIDAFVREDAMQCGFCTPGMVVACYAAVKARGKALTSDEARRATAGNLCRCGTYPHVLAAAVAAAGGGR
jgi:aerobic-type carbon monoxide dehydrogenase small subunit (CoxS/CutS family)